MLDQYTNWFPHVSALESYQFKGKELEGRSCMKKNAKRTRYSLRCLKNSNDSKRHLRSG